MRYMTIQDGRKIVTHFDVLKYELVQIKGGCVGLFFDKCKTIHILYSAMSVDEAEEYVTKTERDRMLYLSGDQTTQHCNLSTDRPFRFYGADPVSMLFKSYKDLSKDAIAKMEENLEKEGANG